MKNSHYRKTSSRGAYGHEPFLSVFEEYPLDSTRSDSTMTLSININSAVVISVVVESSRWSSKTLQKGSCLYAPLDEVLRYGEFSFQCLLVFQYAFVFFYGLKIFTVFSFFDNICREGDILLQNILLKSLLEVSENADLLSIFQDSVIGVISALLSFVIKHSCFLPISSLPTLLVSPVHILWMLDLKALFNNVSL